MTRWTAPRAVALAAGATAALVATTGALSLLASTRPLVATLAVAFLPYAVLVAAPEASHDARKALLLCALAASALIGFDPPLSDDVYRFLWDGRVLRHGIDPYLHAPLDPALAPLRDAHWARVNHPDVPTIYPPLSQLFFAALGALWYSPHAMQLAAVAALLASAALLRREAGERAASLLALNPLALSESALNGHLDIAVGGALLAAMCATRRARPWRAGLWLALATGLKMIGPLLAPVVGRTRRGAGALALVACALVLAPQVLVERPLVGGAGHYARRWQGNGGGFALLEAGARAALQTLAPAHDTRRGHVRLALLEPLLAPLRDTALDPRRGTLDTKKDVPDLTDFELDYLAGLIARAVWMLLLAAAALGSWHGSLSPAPAARRLLLVFLWFAPQVHPWYLLWLLPLECLVGGLAGLVWSVLILVAYAPLDGWLTARVWDESQMTLTVEFGVVLAMFLTEDRRARGGPPVPCPPATDRRRLDRAPEDAAT